MKQCTKCLALKPVGMFYLGKPRKDGSRPPVAACKACDYAKTKKYAQDNREYVLEREKKYRPRYKERRRATEKKWREANPEKTQAYSAKRRRENPEKVAACIKRWHEAHPEKRNASAAKYYESNKEKVKASAKLAVKNISRSYVAHIWGIPTADLPENVYEAHKIHIKIKRLIKNGNV